MTCRECWDPAPDGKELCDWCAMTPEQRKKDSRRRLLFACVVLAAYVGLMIWAAAS